MTRPYYEDDFVTLYHGDAREIAAWTTADVLVTDPPFGIGFESGWTGASIGGDDSLALRDAALAAWGNRPALVFGSPKMPEPSGTRARLVWHRPGSGMGDLALPWQPDWELIHVLGRGFRGERGPSVLVFPWDTFRGDAEHAHRKPIGLMRSLLLKCPAGVVADPFAGSGTTLRAAKDLGRRVVGVEIDERHCDLAARRCAQEVMFA